MTSEQMVENNGMEHVYTMDEALSVIGFGKFQAFVLSYASFGLVAESMELMVLSFIGPSVRDEWELSSEQESLISTAVFGGMLIGACSWGLLSDNYGRRICLLSVAVATGVSAFLSAFSTNYMTLLLFRMLVGIGVSGGHVYTSWFLEFVPVHNRGTWMAIKSLSETVGTILEASLAWVVLPRLGWRWLLALSSIPCFAAFILYFFTVESPRYLYINGRITDANNILTKMAKVNKTELLSGTLVPDQTNEDFTLSQETAPLVSTRRDRTLGPKSSLLALFSPKLVKSTLVLWIVYSCNSFMYYGAVLLTSQLSSGEPKCRNFGGLHLSSSIGRNVFITSLAEIPGRILAAVFVDRIGRRNSLLVSYVCSFFLLLPLMFMSHQSEVVTISFLFGARMSIIGSFTVAGVYCPELYPTLIRSTGVGVATTVARIVTMTSPFVAVGLISNCHQMAAIGLFESVLVVAGFSVFLFHAETKGKELKDVA